jgi:hypothetical protein
MANLEFTSDDIYGLIDRLSSVATSLDNKQWELLLAIVANAAEQIEGAPPDQQRGTLPGARLTGKLKKIEDPKNASPEDLRDQLHHAYVPGQPPPKPMIIRVTPPYTGP